GESGSEELWWRRAPFWRPSQSHRAIIWRSRRHEDKVQCCSGWRSGKRLGLARTRYTNWFYQHQDICCKYIHSKAVQSDRLAEHDCCEGNCDLVTSPY